MLDGPLLSSGAFSIREPLFRFGISAFLLSVIGGLIVDGTSGNQPALVLDVVTLAGLLVVGVAVYSGAFDRSKAVAVLIYLGASNFVFAFFQNLLGPGEGAGIAVYDALFVLALFLGIATFLVGRVSTLLFGALILVLLLVAGLGIQVAWARNNLWLEVPAVAGATYLLFQYRSALDRLLADLQKVIRENRALRDRERLAALGEMTAGIAHEIKNPLNLVVNFAESSQELLADLQALLSHPQPTEADQEELQFLLRELRQNLEDIRSQGLRGAGTVQSMLVQARTGTGEFQAVDLNELAADCLHLAWTGHRPPTARQTMETWPAPVVVKGSRGDLSRALLNLITNALWSVTARKARLEPGYEPRVDVRVRATETWGEVVVSDNGLGLSSQVKSQLFVPFFTTKPVGEGTGLGLSLTRDVIVDQHRGRLDVEGEPDQGASFTLRLPLLGGGA